MVAVDNESEGYTLLERIAERRNGKYYLKNWECPTALKDAPEIHAMAFANKLKSASDNFPKVISKIREEYQQLKRDIDVRGKEVA